MPGRITLRHQTALSALPRESTQAFAGHRDQVAQARAFLARFLADSPAADDAVLLVSELAANTVTDSASGHLGGTFTVRARLSPGHFLYVEVEDQGSAWDGNLAVAKRPHGLHLVRELSADCGTRLGTVGWTTWFTVAEIAAH